MLWKKKEFWDFTTKKGSYVEIIWSRQATLTIYLYLSVCKFVYLSIYLSTHPIIYMCVFLSIYRHLFYGFLFRCFRFRCRHAFDVGQLQTDFWFNLSWNRSGIWGGGVGGVERGVVKVKGVGDCKDEVVAFGWSCCGLPSLFCPFLSVAQCVGVHPALTFAFKSVAIALSIYLSTIHLKLYSVSIYLSSYPRLSSISKVEQRGFDRFFRILLLLDVLLFQLSLSLSLTHTHTHTHYLSLLLGLSI